MKNQSEYPIIRAKLEPTVGKHERKRPLGRPRRKWRDNMRNDLKQIRSV